MRQPQNGGRPATARQWCGAGLSPVPLVALLLLACIMPFTARAQGSARAHAAQQAQGPERPRLSLPPALARILPPPGRLLQGVYPGGRSGEEDDITPADVDAWERATGRKPDWIVFSHNWYRSSVFPAATARWIRARGAIPWIRLMLRSDAREDHAEPRFTLRAIATGRFDTALRAWGRAAARFGTPIFCEYGTEMNGRWFPWNAVWNGRRRGPARFIAAWRHIVDVVRGAGARNVIWVFHVNHEDDPERPWNRFEAYYPGDARVDVLAVSIYSALSPRERTHVDFASALSGVMERFARMAPDKPVIVAEMGTDVHNPAENAALWARQACAALAARRKSRLIGFAWWNETWPNDDDPAHDTDLRVQSSAALARALHQCLPQVAE